MDQGREALSQYRRDWRTGDCIATVLVLAIAALTHPTAADAAPPSTPRPGEGGRLEVVQRASPIDAAFRAAIELTGTGGLYGWFLGTSAATPVVSGAIALLVERWRRDHRGADPSPALVRGLLVHTAVDIGGEPAPPNFDEGWGRLRMDRLLASDTTRIALDQEVLLTDTGASWSASYEVADRSRPVMVTLAWSDPPAMPGASPALVNDLDLELRAGGELFLGNATTTDGRPLADATPDRLNTVERLIATPAADRVEITVRASHLPGDAVPLNQYLVDQDFALVCDNCRLPPPPPRRPSGRLTTAGAAR